MYYLEEPASRPQQMPAPGQDPFMVDPVSNETSLKQYFILLAEPSFGEHILQDQNQLTALENNELCQARAHFKRVEFDYESLLKCDSKRVVEVLSDYDQAKVTV